MNTSLRDGFRVYEEVARSPGSAVSVSVLSQRLSLSLSKTHRILRTLHLLGYIDQEKKSRKYRITKRAWILTSRSIAESNIVLAAREQMDSLYVDLGLNSHLAVLDGFESVYLCIVNGKHYVSNYSQVGGRMPAIISASGKALVCRKPLEYIEQCHAYGRSSPNAETDLATLCEELRQVRESHIAYNYGMLKTDIWGVSTPIFDNLGHIFAALSLSGHKSVYGEKISAELENRLKESAAHVREVIYGVTPLIPWF